MKKTTCSPWFIQMYFMYFTALKARTFLISKNLLHKFTEPLSTKHYKSAHCWLDVGPASWTVAQHLTNSGPLSRVCWVSTTVMTVDMSALGVNTIATGCMPSPFL